MKKLFITLLFTAQAWGQGTGPTQDFKSLIAKNKLGSVGNHAYCYIEDGKTLGYQTERLQRIASVTKVFTTYLASETLDLNKTYQTKFYIGKDSLHIEGGRDPYFEEDKLLILLKNLNDLGYTSFKKVSFNEDFLFYDQAMGNYAKITPEMSKLRLSSYLMGKNTTTLKNKWAAVRKFAEEEGVLLDVETPKMRVSEIVITQTNPLKDENTQVFSHTSRPLSFLLKAMNVQSKNYLAENVFNEASKVKSFSRLMSEVGVKPTSYKIYTGSGLPIISTNSRLDNTATCSLVLKITNLLAQSLKKHGLGLIDVMAINGGKDLGSFRERFENFPHTHEAVISKTGTLKHTSSLAGVLLSEEVIPFAILNHTSSPASARKFQDEFVDRLFANLGEPLPMDYTKISIFPWEGKDFLIGTK